MMNSLNTSVLASFHISASELGLISSSYFLASILSLIPAGILLDKFSTRLLILFALSTTVISTFLFALSPTPILALIARFIAGISGAFCFISSLRLATRWFGPEKLAHVTGIIVAIGMLGAIAAQTPLCFLVDYFGWRMTSVTIGIIGILLILVVYKFVIDSPSGAPQHTTQQTKLNYHSILKTVLANPQNWLTGLYISLMNLPLFILGALWGSLYLTQNYNLSAIQASYIVSMMYLGMLIGSPSIGWISDRIQQRKGLMVFFSIAMLIPISSLVLLNSLNFISLNIIFFNIGFICSSHTLGYPHIAESNPKSLTATAEALASTCMIAGGLTQSLFAWLMQYRWAGKTINGVAVYSNTDFNRAFLMLVTTTLLAISISFFLKDKAAQKRP